MATVSTADVLLIEDSLEEAELTIYALRGTCTHITVDTFTRADDSMCYLLRTGPFAQRDAKMPQLILLDFDAPGIDAKQMLRRLKSDDVLKTIPVVVLTGQHEARLTKECYALGANSVLCKARQLREYFDQMQQLAKYWLLVNAAAGDDADELQPPSQSSRTGHSVGFTELRNN
jgi:CheY-like chemotaxis protein